MEYRSLGASGLTVSNLCSGTMMFGGPTDDATAERIVARARDQGVNFIDTADGYSGGRSEEAVGRAPGAPWVVGVGDEVRQPDRAGAECAGFISSPRAVRR